MIYVVAGAFFVMVITPLIIQRQRSGHMATVEAQVSIGDVGSDSTQDRNAPIYRWPDSEVPRTAERLRDVSAVAVASITYVVESAMSGRTPHNAGEIIAGITQRQLIPNEWLTTQNGVLQLPHGTIHLRYSPNRLSVELISVPNEPKDGPAILIRVPDDENTGVGVRYFESMQLNGIVYPSPFAPLSDVISTGWRPRLFKQTQLPETERAQLEQWAKSATRK